MELSHPPAREGRWVFETAWRHIRVAVQAHVWFDARERAAQRLRVSREVLVLVETPCRKESA